MLPRFPPSSLPFPFPSPGLSGLDFSPGGGPTQWVRKCLCGCVECGTCPTYRDVELTAIVMRWINLLPGLCTSRGVLLRGWASLGLSHTPRVRMSCAPGWSPARSRQAGESCRVHQELLHQPCPEQAAVGSCVRLQVDPSDLTFSHGAPPLSLVLRLEEEMPCKLSEVMDWL